MSTPVDEIRTEPLPVHPLSQLDTTPLASLPEDLRTFLSYSVDLAASLFDHAEVDGDLEDIPAEAQVKVAEVRENLRRVLAALQEPTP